MPNERQPDVLVIGGGLHGLSAALHLGLRGLKARVLEKDYPGRHASGVNAGGVRRLGRHLAEVPLSDAAMKIWHDMPGFVGDDCGFTRCAQVKVAETDPELEALKRRADSVTTIGFDHEEIICAAELREVVPAIAPHCVGAIICRDDGAALPFRAVTAFRRKAMDLGAEVISGAPVTAIERRGALWRVRAGRHDHEAPILINSAGAWGAEVAAMLGERPPLEAHAPMLMITERVAPFLTPVLGSQGRKLSFKQYENGTVLIGGGHRGETDPALNRTTTRLAGMAASARTVAALFPQLQNVRIVRAWAGIEGVTPDGIPVIGPSSTNENAFHSFGYSYHGFQLGPITGKIISDLIVDGATDLPVEPFRIGRFNDLGVEGAG